MKTRRRPWRPRPPPPRAGARRASRRRPRGHDAGGVRTAKVETAKARAREDEPRSRAAKADPPSKSPLRPPRRRRNQGRDRSARAAARGSAKPAERRRAAEVSRGDALFEAAAAARPGAGGAPAGAARLPLAHDLGAPTQFTGEPISLDLKDADIKDVFRTISQLTGLNIVIDPEVRGTVTVQLEDVPWDQALDLILKQNSLGYVLENNIMRIATTAKLQAEEADRARLAEARQAAEPRARSSRSSRTRRRRRSSPTLQSVMSKRGSIVVDQRTNTLIIREIPTTCRRSCS
jgi:type IV pilus assembly protein PilQ